mgnify:CR=1 FL=1
MPMYPGIELYLPFLWNIVLLPFFFYSTLKRIESASRIFFSHKHSSSKPHFQPVVYAEMKLWATTYFFLNHLPSY